MAPFASARSARVVCAAFVLVWILWGALSPGTFNDDDVTHYYMAKESLADPSLMTSLWGRPLFTFLYAFPAQLGYGAVEVFTAVIMGVTLWLTWRLALTLGLAAPLAAVFFTALQPFFFKLGFACLVEPIGALCLTGAWLALMSDRAKLAGLLIGLLPLTRFELIVVVPLLLIPLLRRRHVTAVVIAALPLLAWNAAGFAFFGNPVWLAEQLLGGHFTRSFAGAQPLSQYVRTLPMVVGGAFMPLFVLGVVPRRGETRWLPWIRFSWVAVLVVLSLLAWRAHGFGGSVGYLRHMVSVGPMMGLLVSVGFERALEGTRTRWVWLGLGGLSCAAIPVFELHLATWEHPVNRAVEPWIWLVGAVATLLVFAWHLAPRTRLLAVVAIGAVTTLVAEPPIPLDGERRLVRDAAMWVRANRPGRAVAVNHPWFPFLLGADRNDARRFPHVDLATLSRLPAGTIVVWEPHYGPRIGGDVPLAYFAEHADRYVPIYKDDVRRDVPGYGEHVFPLVVFEVAP